MARKFLLVLGLLLAFVALLIYLGDTECNFAGFDYRIGDTLREWDDALKVIEVTPKSELAPQIEKLQALDRRFKDKALPACYREIQANYIKYMDGVIDGFLSFMAGEGEDVVKQKFSDALVYFDAAMVGLKGLKK